jgi:hypothetical protein
MIGCDAVGWVVVLLVGGCGSVGVEASKELHNCTFAFVPAQRQFLCQSQSNVQLNYTNHTISQIR